MALKYLGEPAVTFAEFPDEIALCFNITNCPGTCERCSEPELRLDIGDELTEEALDAYIARHPGITLVGFMGGDRDHGEISALAEYLHDKHNLKVGMYSGMDFLDAALLDCLDYYKIGRWIAPVGEPRDWHKKNCGPIKFAFSNQLMFKKVGNCWANITCEFRKTPLNDLKKEII